MKTLVESCFILDTKLIKKDLRLAREHKEGVSGFFNMLLGSIKTVADYYIEYQPEHDYLVIQYSEVEQRVKLTESELKFGPRSWFVCDCGCRVGKLYMPQGGKEFKCRSCHNLVYELTTFDRNSKQGQFKYNFNRLIKSVNIRESMRSIFYNGTYTARFNRYLEVTEKLGLGQVKQDARELLDAINN